MIGFSFNIDYTNDVEFKNFWHRSWSTPLTHKFIELEIHTSNSIVGFDFDFTTQCDHAGLDIQITVFGRTVHFNVYDDRHWNYKENCYSD
jgi:hypothetical protein